MPPTASDYNKFVHSPILGASLGGGEQATIDGPVTVAVQPAGRVTFVLTDADDAPQGSPVVVGPGGTFSIGAGARATVSALDTFGAAMRFAWG